MTEEPDPHRERVEGVVVTAIENLLAGGESFSELPVARIARKAGIARSTFYLYFPDKRRLLLTVGGQTVDSMFAPAITWWRAEHSDGPAGVARAIRGVIDGYRAHRRMVNALIEVAAYDPEVAAFWNGKLAEFIRIAAQRLRALRKTGAVAADLDCEHTAAALTFMVERTIPRQLTRGGGAADARLAKALGAAIWRTVYGGSG